MVAYKVFKKFLSDNKFREDLNSIKNGEVNINCYNTVIFLKTVIKLKHISYLNKICEEILDDESFVVENNDLKVTVSKEMKEISFGPGFYLEIIRKELIERIRNG
jgi:hypothetical protein